MAWEDFPPQTWPMSPVAKSSPLRERLTDLLVRAGFPLIGVFLLTAGLWGVLSFAVLPAITLARTQAWQPQPAVVESVALRHPSSRLHPPLDTVEVRYRYAIEGVEYSESALDPQFGLYLRSASTAAFSQLRDTPRITVWVNPQRPQEAVASRDFRGKVFLFAIPSLLLAILGGRMLFVAMLAWNRARPRAMVPGLKA